MSVASFIRLATTTTLQQRVKDLGLCPKCHTKTLVQRFNNGEILAEQSSSYLTVYVDEARKLIA